MNTKTFSKAEKKKAWMKVAITGPSGSGKTYSALLMASGMGKRVAVIDTENGSASLYADEFEFDVLEIDPPYTVRAYIDALQAAIAANYEVVVIDSISHAWAGEGGLLQQKEEADARGGKGERNKFTNWGQVTKQHEQFKASLLKADIHMIVTMRSKQDYVLAEGNIPKKVGMAPIQREGMEYEFTTVLDMAMNHSAQSSKDRTKLFDGKIFIPTRQSGEQLIQWLNSGKGELKRSEIPSPKDVVPQPKNNASGTGTIGVAHPNQDQLAKLFTLNKEAGWEKEELRNYMREKFKKDSTKTLTITEYNLICNELLTIIDARKTDEERIADMVDKEMGITR